MTQSITQLIQELESAEAGKQFRLTFKDSVTRALFGHSATFNDHGLVSDALGCSLDAATALVERALPDHQWRVVVFSDCSAECECLEPRAAAQGGERWQRLRTGCGNTEPIARVSALLKAIQAKEEAGR